jgi:hypothetical protein
MPARRRTTKQDTARANQRHKPEAAETITWLVFAASLAA